MRGRRGRQTRKPRKRKENGGAIKVSASSLEVESGVAWRPATGYLMMIVDGTEHAVMPEKPTRNESTEAIEF